MHAAPAAVPAWRGMPHDESHSQTQPLRVERIPRPFHDKAVKGAEPGERLIGRRYRLEERLRRRRLGIVFAAVDELGWLEGQQRRVAIQFLDAKLAAGPDFTERFERGVATLQSLEHRGLVRTFDAGKDGNRYFLAIELPDSGTLRYVLDDVRRLPPTEAGAVVRAIGDALEYLHARSIVHGNLKPENVVVTFDFDVKLQDVVPPEWPVAQEERTVRDDVYALACLAYEMLAGRHPFDGNSAREALQSGLKPEPIPRLPPKQWRALVGALEHDPAHRTPTVRQFLEEFGVVATAGLRDIVENDIAASTPAPVTPVPQPAPWIGGGDAVIVDRSTRYGRPRTSFGGKLLLVILAALVALVWKYQDEIRDRSAAFVAMVDAWVPAKPAQETPSDPAAATPAATIEEDPIARVTATPDGSAVITPAPVEAPPVPEDAAPTTAPPATQAPPPATEAAPSRAPAAETPAPEAAPAPPGPVRFGFGQTELRVAESAVAARILIRRSGDLRGSAAIAWWTAPGTANAERDFADLGRKVERFRPGERERTVYVPLSNDTDAESSEYFNVFIGDVQGGMEPQAGIRVEIADDD